MSWDAIGAALADDFAFDPATLVQTIVRLIVAALLGGVLGWQREMHGKAAGMRTHMLVALGTAAFVLIPNQLGWDTADLSRIIQGIAAGIGFLGAGAILKRTDEGMIYGLTTAADIWLTAAIGIAAGEGRLLPAIVIAGLALVILSAAIHFGPKPLEEKGKEGEQRSNRA